jgi:hypothetical protein
MIKSSGGSGSLHSDCRRFCEKHSARLALLLFLSTPLCRSQDASCKAVADAQILLAKTPHHVVSTDVQPGRIVNSESISTPGGVFWRSNGIWHRSTSSMQEFSRATADALKELRGCNRVGDELVDARPATKYTLHNAASGGDETVWIAKGSGLPLKTEALIESRRISSHYDYSNIQPPANVR